jgi:ABC-type polysaccharide/polyol phosphate export permease
MTAILSVVFTQIMHQDIRRYAPRLLGGLAVWQFILRSSLMGCQTFFLGRPYIRAHPLPIAIYPLRNAMVETFHLMVALVVVVFMAAILVRPPFSPIALLSLVPTVVLLFLLAWSLAVMTGFANVHFQDTQHILEIGFQLVFYATPIIYPPEVLIRNNLGWLLEINPVVAFLQLIQAPVMSGTFPPLAAYGKAALMVAIAMSLASLTLNRLQRKLIFHL